MPFLFPLLGVFGIAIALSPRAADIPQPKPTTNIQPLPWYVPATLVVVGGLLLYKTGAKALKV